MSKIKALRFPPAIAKDMINGILDGRKTVMRVHPFQLPDKFSSLGLERMEYRKIAIYKTEEYKWKNESKWAAVFGNDAGINYIMPCRYQPGDVLYMQETWQFVPCDDCTYKKEGECNCEPVVYGCVNYVKKGCFIFKADNIDPKKVGWHSSTSMPREAARLFLRVENVRVERLRSITLGDISKEGIPNATDKDWLSLKPGHEPPPPFCWYARAWKRATKPADRDRYGWDANPWVEVVEFKEISKEEALDDCT